MGGTAVSTSFGSLRWLADSFLAATSHTPASRRRALEVARDLGDVAIPLLARKLRDANQDHASWAYYLLAHVGGARVTEVARAMAMDAAVPDTRKALALALLSELGAELPDDVSLTDPEALRAASVQDLVDTLREPADVARTVDLLLEQVGASELPIYLGEMIDVAGGAMGPLLDEAVARDDLPVDVVAAVRAMRDTLPAVAPAPPPARRKADVLVAMRDDGHVLLLARRGRRAFLVEVDRGRLAATRHHADLTRRDGAALRRELGADAAPCDLAEAHGIVAAAVRATRTAGQPLGRDYYLGRDLLGLAYEHLAPANSAADDDAAADLFGRASDLLDEGKIDAALELSSRYVDRWPDDAEGRSLHGTCLLEAGRLKEAIVELRTAVRLAPDEPLHRWNLAHAAKRADRLGDCYLALSDYLRARDSAPGAASRARIARQFVRLFEKFARMEHPGVDTVAVARADELFERATRHLDAGRLPDAVAGFEAVLKLVPSHYASWSNLGVAHALGRRVDDAERCLLKALEFRPDYEVARQNLERLGL